jgi:hypothetical protein
MIYTHAPSQAVGLLADSNLGPKEAVQNMLSRGILDSMAHVKVLVLRGGLFTVFGRFGPGWVDFEHFRGSFFPFLLFFQLRHTVYSHGEPEADV